MATTVETELFRVHVAPADRNAEGDFRRIALGTPGPLQDRLRDLVEPHPVPGESGYLSPS